MDFDVNSAFIGQFDQVISHFDGNNNDPDDIAALPLAAALTNATGLQNKSTFFYNNNLGEPDISPRVAAMRKSAAFAEKLGIRTHDYQAGTDAATAALVKILNSGQKVLALEGGPMEAIYRALEQTSPRSRANVTLMSHSSFNEDRNVASRPGVDDVRTWADIRSDFPEVELLEIQDQNGSGDAFGFNSSRWNWLDDTSDPVLEEARGLMENAGASKVNDPSDAGMLFYALTGNEAADPQDAETFFEAFSPFSGAPPAPMPPAPPAPAPALPAPTPTPTPIPVPAPTPPEQSLLTLALVNADTDQVVEGYEDLGANPEINLGDLDLKKFSLIALSQS